MATRFDSERGRELQRRKVAKDRERRQELELAAVEKLEGRLLDAIDTYIKVMADKKAPHAARLAASDWIVERILGKVGERLLVAQETRAEVTVRYDVDRLAALVSELQGLGAIEPAELPDGSGR